MIVVAVVATVVPEENIERLQNLNPFAAGTLAVGSRSTEKRVETVELAGRMVADHPIFGVGLGNFREVSRQIYLDQFWRPPHNSYMWALTEGGFFCLVLYGMLFASTWRDIRWLQESPAVPPDLRWLAAALAPGFLMLLFFSAFADIWLTPITYIMIALPIVFRRYVSRRRVVVV
jgi:O-antigen ligase